MAIQTPNQNTDEVEVTYEGLVLGTTSDYWDGDSTYFALVWDEDSQGVKQVYYETSRYWTDKKRATATVDASVDVLDKACKWGMKKAIAYAESKAIGEAMEVERNKIVEVVKGRKVKKGTRGTVVVVHEGQWGLSVLLRLADGSEVWTSINNVEVVNYQQYMVTEERIIEGAVAYFNRQFHYLAKLIG